MSANTLLITVDILKERTSIHDNIDEKLLYPDIKFAQDTYILPILGTALFNKLQTLISAGTMGDAANANYKSLMDTYIIDAMIYYVLMESGLTMGFQFTNKGLVRKTGENLEVPTMAEMVDISNRYKHRAETYAHRLKEYLRAHASSSNCPEYLSPGTASDTITPEQRAFTLPIYLGDDDCNRCINDQPYSE